MYVRYSVIRDPSRKPALPINITLHVPLGVLKFFIRPPINVKSAPTATAAPSPVGDQPRFTLQCRPGSNGPVAQQHFARNQDLQ
jgi:hypothetical protein